MQVAALARVAEQRGWPADRSIIRANIEAQGLSQAAKLLRPATDASVAGFFERTKSFFWRR
jgi:hypothetical protein